jgi:hypothetical protein
MPTGDDLAANGEAEASVGDEIDGEPAQAGKLRAAEHEDLRDEDPDEQAAHEPVKRDGPGAREGQHAPADERGTGDRRADLRDRLDALRLDATPDDREENTARRELRG